MSLSKPKNPVFIAGVAPPATESVGLLDVNENATRVNQLHGIASNNALGAGIPNQVTNVQASVANAQTGATCAITVLYRVDPTDKNFAGVNIWVKGYQGNNQLVRVASGATSPTKFVLNNTGEIVSFTVQAYGNGGSAPLISSPTCSGTLPQSTGGGFGTTTIVTTSSVALLKTNGVNNSTQTLLNLTSTEKSLYLTESGGSVDIEHKIFYTRFMYPQFNAGNYLESPPTSLSAASGGIGSPTVAIVPPTASVPGYIKHSCPASTGNAVTVYGTLGKLRLDLIKRCALKLAVFENTSVRDWFGVSDSNLPQGGTFVSDNPAQNIVGFRFSTAAGDTHYQACCQTGAGAQTLVDTGISPDTSGAFHVFEFRSAQGTPGTILFYIDNVQVATISTNVPTSTLGLNPLVYTETRTTAARSVGVVLLSFEFFS